MNIEQRLEKLERQNRWMKTALLGLLVICVGVVLMGAAGSDEVKTKALYILDDNGRMAVKIHASKGRGNINLWDANMKKQSPQISISCVESGGTQIFMKNGKGERAINLVAQDKGRIHRW